MIYRLWTTGVDPTQLERYREFARSRSLPMLRGSTFHVTLPHGG